MLTVKYLTKKEYNFHTYSIKSDLNLKIELRGFPESLDLQLIENDLRNKKFNPIKVSRMLKRDKTPMPLVIVELPKHESNIYNIQKCLGLIIRVEPLKKPNQMGRCLDCQTFGHSQRNCHGQPKCVKCADLHPSQECPQPNTIIAKCTNCNGPHPARYRRCPAYPPNQINQSQKKNKQTHGL